jgi:hypothetical protein
MGVVYLARQAALDRDVALKRLDLDPDALLAQRFVREAHLAAALDHPNVVTVYDFFEYDGVPYIAMEYVAGGSLRPFVGRLAMPQVFRVLEGVLTGLGHAEERGVAHRDLKPENILLTPRGGVKLADFGIARAYNAVTAPLTSTSSAIGTPAYMAPEQAQSQPLGPYTDVYAVGVIAYELLAGRQPFEGSTPVAVLYQHVHTPPPPLADHAPDVPPRVREWVDWLLAKDPSRRPASATAAWESLEEIAVDGLGPYWRRAGGIAAPPRAPEDDPAVAAAAETTADSPPPAPTVVEPDRRVATARPHAGISRRRVAAAAAVTVTAALLALVVLRPDDPARSPASHTVTPFDFDGDGREELVLALPGSARRGGGVASGVVLVHEGPGVSESAVITAADVGVPRPFRDSDRFGAGLASADFDRDGRADLAIGAPGRELVALAYGTPAGLDGKRSQRIDATATRLPPGGGRYGLGLAAGDLNADGFGDLVIGTPGRSPTRPGVGALQIVFGSPAGLDVSRARTIPPPGEPLADFGNRVRVGDIDDDGHVDVIAGAPDRLSAAASGHLTYCPGTRRGPTGCERLGVTADGGTSSLAIADVNADGYEDIVQGDGTGEPADGGEVRLWLGGPRGPSARPTAIDQDSRYVRGVDEAGDGFGTIVDVGDVDSDGFADMVVAAPYKHRGAGAVTIIRGGRRGYALSGSSTWDKRQPGVPGTAAADDRFGSALGLLRLTDDDRLDLVVISGGATRLGAAVTLIEGDVGVFAPSEARATRLRLADQVEPEGIESLRIGRPGRQPSPH